MNGQGEPGLRGGPSGDLYIVVGVKPHKLFKREGYNLLLDFPISFVTAALGGDVEVPTLSGPVKYRIPEGTQPGSEFRIKGSGIQQLRGNGKGDLILKVKVEIPKRLNNKQKDLLKQFEETTSDLRVGQIARITVNGNESYAAGNYPVSTPIKVYIVSKQNN